MATIETSTDIIRSAETCTVSIARTWADDWQVVPHLFCNSLTWCAGPKVACADFEWRYGIGMRQGEQGFSQVPGMSLNGWWVKVEVSQAGGADPLYWYGIFQEIGTNPEGAWVSVDGTNRVPRGRQPLLAYGPEILLDTPITSSWYKYQGMEREVGRGLTFNENHHVRPSGGIDKKKHVEQPGNRSPSTGQWNTHLFAEDLSTGAVWTIRDIVCYLLAYHSPVAADGTAVIPFTLDFSGDALPDWGRPVVPMHGQSVRQLLGELISRQRCLGYTFELEEENGVRLRTFTFADTALFGSEGVNIPANPSQINLDFDIALDVESAHLKESMLDYYDAVEIIGARIVLCGTISGANETLVKHWTTAQATEYNEAAKNEADYSSLNVAQKAARNKLFRTSDRLKKVYCYFGLPAGLEPYVDLPESEDGQPLFPYVDGTEENSVLAGFYTADMRFLAQLPLKTTHDYSGTKISTNAVDDLTPPGYSWEYRPILVALKVKTKEGKTLGEGDRYVDVHKMSALADSELVDHGASLGFTCSVHVQENAPGIVVKVHNGEGQQELAGSDWTAADTTDKAPGGFDYKDDMLVTFAMEADYHVSVQWPETTDPARDFERIMRIDASHRFGLHWVAPGTVVEIRDGLLVRSDSGGFIRDDYDEMLDLAKLAWQWYGSYRQSFTLSYKQATCAIKVGDLITTIGAGDTLQNVRSVVTEIHIDFARSNKDTHRTTIHTSFGELDVLKLL
jgi:hypothetical protein